MAFWTDEPEFRAIKFYVGRLVHVWDANEVSLVLLKRKIVFSYESANTLSEQSHLDAYVVSFVEVISMIRVFFPTESKIVWNGIAMVYGIDDEIGLSNLARKVYFSNNFEELLAVISDNGNCDLYCNSDPVVFTLVERGA
ncbi:MAG: hypothetical protein JNN30_19415 [Rhodanobacteraceae bacterium]|nr:hypothetical protein [Rhodanobacteraceae bacterium]